MGGYGSGQHNSVGAKRTVESCTRIGVIDFIQPYFRRMTDGQTLDANLARSGDLEFNVTLERYDVYQGRMLLPFIGYPDRVGQKYEIPIESTESNLPNNTGRVYWFRCPHKKCKRRIVYLYSQDPNQWPYMCRKCYDLQYCSTRETRFYRNFLIWGIMNGIGDIESLPAMIKGMKEDRQRPAKEKRRARKRKIDRERKQWLKTQQNPTQ